MASKTNSKRKAATSKGPDNGNPTGESLDQVRDILFGGQMRAVESRLERLESKIMREVDNVRDEASGRMDGIEAQMLKEAAAFKEKLQTERSKRAEDIKALATELKSASKDLDKRLGNLDNIMSKADAELRDQILQNATAATAQLKQRTDDVRDELDRHATELRSEKIDTAALVALFSDMALRLTDELPGDPEA
jgi:hypothetical protein